MLYRDEYEIEIESNGTSIISDPKDISFTLSENIYNIYSTGLIEVTDSTGILQESLLTMKGSNLEITYGNIERSNRTPMIILNDRTEEEPVQTGILSTKVSVPIIHSWYKEQEVKSFGHRGEISSIVRDIVEPYRIFDSMLIEGTNGTDIWYQCFVDDASFIENYLLPNAFSFNADSTPFCAFTTLDNVFNFTHMKKFFNENVVATLDYSQRANIETISENPVSSIRRIKDRTDFLGELSEVVIYQINRNSGRLESRVTHITDYNKPSSRKLPYIGSIEGASSILDLDYVEPSTNQENNNTAQILFNQRRGMFLDRFMVLIPLNSDLHCGDKVQLNIDSSLDDSQSKFSNVFSSPYIIESLDHVWSGENHVGYTRLLLGRKYVSVPETYEIKSRMAP